ncbi:hypothetical protein DM01DRAFT_1133287 [Hesseltinella vesiculosa]|uniref:Uncharacterized protein n=1 Tax=Hesseltinella vesiculosa TaxID=101127 RepID=A0A1X2G8M8_9FUNG|nr:hypothetical protein DM01DRAFT_1133287 [Hesseltinella vesiculosa]
MARGPESNISSTIRPSVHPSQTMSYDIKSTQKGPSKASDGIEDRVKQLCNSLAQNNSSKMGYVDESSSHFTSYIGNVTLASSHSYSLSHGPQESNSAKAISILKMKQPPKTPSPVSLASLSAGSPSPPGSVDRLADEVEQIKIDFDKRLGQVILDYEQSRQVVQQLEHDLKSASLFRNPHTIFSHSSFLYVQKDDELTRMRQMYESSIKDNNLLYEAFKNELEQLLAIPEPSHSDHQNCQRASSRPSHPNPEAQLRKKLETTLMERNQWHKTACQLARELQEIAQDGPHQEASHR